MKQELITLACKALSESMPSLLLRGHDDHARIEGDIDYLVPRGQAVFACRLVAELARSTGWYVLSFRNIGYLASLVLARPSVDGSDVAIKIDFFSGLEWYGVGDGTVSARFFEQALPEALENNEQNKLVAAVNFFQKCMVVGRLSQRDWDRIVAGGATSNYLLKIAKTLQLPMRKINVTERGLGRISKWRLRAASSGWSGFFDLSAWLVRVVYTHLCFKAVKNFSSGLVFGLSGLDGSGKSTQMDRLLASYMKSGMGTPRLVHLLPEWIPLPHQVIRRKKTVSNYTRPYSEAAVSSRLNGVARLGYYLLAFFIAKISMSFSARRDTIFLMDRNFIDFAVDLSRSRIPDYKLPSWLLRACTPNGLLIYIDASAESVVQRKGELTIEKAKDLSGRYLRLFALIGCTIIDGEATPTDVYSHILKKIDLNYFTRISRVTCSQKDGSQI